MAGHYALARNDSLNPSDPGRWTRIDWLPLPGMTPYEWGYCHSAYAPSLAAAETTRIAQRKAPKAWCNGFPFSRMRRPAAPRQ